MYVLDTNVISEVMKEAPDAAAAAWLRTCPVEAMLTTTISQSQILYGSRRLPTGRRRYRLSAAVEAMFGESLARWAVARRQVKRCHDVRAHTPPVVIQRYPAPSAELEGVAGRLDTGPAGG